jgi:hypothetical protein
VLFIVASKERIVFYAQRIHVAQLHHNSAQPGGAEAETAFLDYSSSYINAHYQIYLVDKFIWVMKA